MACQYHQALISESKSADCMPALLANYTGSYCCSAATLHNAGMLIPSCWNCPTDLPRVGLSGSFGLFTKGPGDCVGTTLPPLVPGACSAGPPGAPFAMFGSLPYTTSEIQSPTVNPLW